ncbi:MAG: GNAT family protein [Trueperaceae bacterium]|nr:GNAT family protein [Trueperaceae bacterium]
MPATAPALPEPPTPEAAALRAAAHAAARRLPLDAGDGVRVRRLAPADAPALFARIDASRAHLRAWLDWVDATRAPSDTEAFLRASAERFEATGALDVGLERDGVLVGMIGMNAVDPAARRAEIGYWLAADATGRGTVTRALGALASLWFGPMGLARTEILVHPDNAASRAVAERAGYAPVGVRAGGGVRDGVPFDLLVYARTAPDAAEEAPR